jgi:cell wall-associated NlpC family hydrolase
LGVPSKPKRRLKQAAVAGTALLAALLAAPVLHPSIASASTHGNDSLNWAEDHADGCWYHYGGTSCSPGYDCSGLVSTAVKEATGIWIGRTTYDIMHSPNVALSHHPERGDLVFFYGGSHVEFLTAWPHQTFGAHDTGSRVSWLSWGNSWPAGTSFYYIK